MYVALKTFVSRSIGRVEKGKKYPVNKQTTEIFEKGGYFKEATKKSTKPEGEKK